jgi:hypothetical protein
VKSVRRPNDPHEMPRWRFAARDGLYSIKVAGARANPRTWLRTTPKVRGKAARRADKQARRRARERGQVLGTPAVCAGLISDSFPRGGGV